jgi:hypothetical protein
LLQQLNSFYQLSFFVIPPTAGKQEIKVFLKYCSIKKPVIKCIQSLSTPGQILNISVKELSKLAHLNETPRRLAAGLCLNIWPAGTQPAAVRCLNNQNWSKFSLYVPATLLYLRVVSPCVPHHLNRHFHTAISTWSI